MRKLLSRRDINGTANRLFGYGICRHCVNMLCRAIEGRGEYVVPRCPRCGLTVDSRLIDRWQRQNILNDKTQYVGSFAYWEEKHRLAMARLRRIGV